MPNPDIYQILMQSGGKPGKWWKDPALPGMLTTIGGALGAPPSIGQTGWGRAAQALAQGMAYRQAYNAAQQKALMDALKMVTEQAKTGAEINELQSRSGMQQARGELYKAQASNAPKQMELEEKKVALERENVKTQKDMLQLRRQELERMAKLDSEKLALEREKLAKELEQEKAKLAQQEKMNVRDNATRMKIAELNAKIKAAEVAQKAKDSGVSPKDVVGHILKAAEVVSESGLLGSDPNKTFELASKIVGSLYGLEEGAQQPGGAKQPATQPSAASQPAGPKANWRVELKKPGGYYVPKNAKAGDLVEFSDGLVVKVLDPKTGDVEVIKRAGK